jgi:hypothetical protein
MMSLETYVAVTALVFLVGLFTGGAAVWLWVEPLLRRAEFAARFARNKAANAEALVRLVRKLEDPDFPGELRRIK